MSVPVSAASPGASTEPPAPLTIGVVNPFALAEVRLGRRINWSTVGNRPKLLEATLEFPYDKLFDPATGSPLYPGLEVEQGAIVRTGGEPAAMATEHRSDADLPVGNGGAAADGLGISVGGTSWIDPGDFFEEATELLDPVQGAVGDCYLIAALSSVAWAQPYVIAQRNRATANAGTFVDVVEFFNGSTRIEVEVSEKLPLGTPGNYFLYCRSSDPGEIWPAIYEKAYAKWRTGDPGDQPNILAPDQRPERRARLLEREPRRQPRLLDPGLGLRERPRVRDPSQPLGHDGGDAQHHERQLGRVGRGLQRPGRQLPLRRDPRLLADRPAVQQRRHLRPAGRHVQALLPGLRRREVTDRARRRRERRRASSEQLLPVVDVQDRAGDRGIGHDVERQGGDVLGLHDAAGGEARRSSSRRASSRSPSRRADSGVSTRARPR
jgi:hypothetical protein